VETKTYIWIGIFIGSTVGGVMGGALDHGNFLGAWSLLLGTLGSIVGIWAGYKIGNS
jgi:membrane protein DedA with SNARE-associated domain